MDSHNCKTKPQCSHDRHTRLKKKFQRSMSLYVSCPSSNSKYMGRMGRGYAGSTSWSVAMRSEFGGVFIGGQESTTYI